MHCSQSALNIAQYLKCSQPLLWKPASRAAGLDQSFAQHELARRVGVLYGTSVAEDATVPGEILSRETDQGRAAVLVFVSLFL